MDDDQEFVDRIVTRVQAGENAAVADLFDLYHEPVYRYVASRLREPSDAEDVTQDVFLRVIRALPRYERRGLPFRAWLFTLARNAVIDFHRTRRVHVGLDAYTNLPSPEPGPEAESLARSEAAVVELAMAALTDDHREVVALRFFGDLSSAEVAAVMGRSEGAVRVLQFRALHALRRELVGNALTEVTAPGLGSRRA